MIGCVERYLLDKIMADGAIHLTLLDPERTTSKQASKIVLEAEISGTAAIMVGGSTLTSVARLESLLKVVKKSVKIPVILFPNNVTSICKYADAIWFMSLLNSSDPYFIAGAQILSAPLVKKFSLEPLPMGYIIVGEGGAASVIGRAFPIPYNKPELAAAYALAAQYLGMRFAYLEAGSGVKFSVPKEMVETVKHVASITLIVGGGIRTGKQAKELVEAGADIIVTGTIAEEGDTRDKIGEIVQCVQRKNRG
jgi:phosphoglycerol geranylgeranyltransferase